MKYNTDRQFDFEALKIISPCNDYSFTNLSTVRYVLFLKIFAKQKKQVTKLAAFKNIE
jgi:hypothetical protein